MADPLQKRITEVRVYTFSFAKFPEIVNGETLASVDLIWSNPVDVNLTIGAGAVVSVTDVGLNGNSTTYPQGGVAATISAGTQETGYDLYCRAVTNTGHKLVAKGKLYVGDGA